jgi:hypothetical protein
MDEVIKTPPCEYTSKREKREEERQKRLPPQKSDANM